MNFPTLELVLTNLQDHYETPTPRPPRGLSDHTSIEVQPKVRIKSNNSTSTIQSRDMCPSKRLAVHTYLESVDLDTIILNSADSCEGKTLLLEQIIKTGLDHVMPMRTRKVHSTEPPWIKSSLKNLLQKRQSGDVVTTKCFVSWEIALIASERCAAQIITKPRWNIWRNVNHLSGEKKWKSSVGTLLPSQPKSEIATTSATPWNRYNICMRELTKSA